MTGLLAWLRISGLTSLEWLVRGARPHAMADMPLSGYPSRQKSKIRPKAYTTEVGSRTSEVQDLSLIQRVTHRGDEFFVVERFHEKCNRANGHCGGACGQIFARGDDDDTGAR
jgi:hypothetical protein